MTAPEIKKLQNDETPPCHITQGTRTQLIEVTPMKMEQEGTLNHEQGQESLQVKEKPLEKEADGLVQEATEALNNQEHTMTKKTQKPMQETQQAQQEQAKVPMMAATEATQHAMTTEQASTTATVGQPLECRLIDSYRSFVN